MKRLCALALCVAFTGLLRAESFDLSGFSKLVEIRSSADSVAPGVVLTDFQVLVRLSADIEGFSYSDFRQDNGADLAFLDGDKNLLAHEIDTWNTEGESLVWVKIPAFQRGTKIYMVYGNAAYEPGGSAADTWSGYTGVWHMKEAEGTVEDATGNGLSATPSGARAQYNVGIDDGVVGMARKNGGNGGNALEDRAYLSVPNYDSFALADTFTVSGFFRIDGSGGWYRLFSRRGSDGGWGQEVYCNDAETVYVYGAGGPAPTVNVPGLGGGGRILRSLIPVRRAKSTPTALLSARSVSTRRRKMARRSRSAVRLPAMNGVSSAITTRCAFAPEIFPLTG